MKARVLDKLDIIKAINENPVDCCAVTDCQDCPMWSIYCCEVNSGDDDHTIKVLTGLILDLAGYKKKVIIHVDGGIVQSIFSDIPDLDIEVLDTDESDFISADELDEVDEIRRRLQKVKESTPVVY